MNNTKIQRSKSVIAESKKAPSIGSGSNNQKVIILTIDPTLNQDNSDDIVSPKTEYWRKVFANDNKPA